MSNSDTPDEMLQEYDFSGGERGKHVRDYHQGYTVTIHHADGTETVKTVEMPPGTIVLAPDLREHFPDSATVNRVLRGLLALIPEKK